MVCDIHRFLICLSPAQCYSLSKLFRHSLEYLNNSYRLISRIV
ncbi:hypothetical protein T12_10037 [Trichinella patagoniensis]|uniref:Uncharacterized protein n=1 Tax=Trichinella patagoniensis TaxID=990121 RepID=A0A0V0YYG1_9BILA|nr:hypothetical protein T12_10037 [Trichinella patagoniensis]